MTIIEKLKIIINGQVGWEDSSAVKVSTSQVGEPEFDHQKMLENHTHVYTYTHTHIYTHIHKCIYTHKHTHTYMYGHIKTHFFVSH